MSEATPTPDGLVNRLAVHLARRIFEAPYGCDPDQTQRIQFRGPGESDMGGLCESALVNVIAEALENFK